MTRGAVAGRGALVLAALALLGACADELWVGAGDQRFAWSRDWPRFPAGRALGDLHGGIAFDDAGRVYVESDDADAVWVFAPDGTLEATWGTELAGGLHGIAHVSEAGGEFLYLTHIAQGAVFKTDLAGTVVWRAGCPLESGRYESPDQYHPTSVAIAPNGDVYVADGYGLSYVHRYDREHRYVGSFGGQGDEPGRLRNPHGIWVDGQRGELWVADRENRRLQVFDLAGEPLRVLDRRTSGHDPGRPAFVEVRGDEVLVADIEGRVAILDRTGRLVQELGRNPDPELTSRNDVPRAQQRAGAFISPHCARWDARGDVYVVDWLREGRITKLVRRGGAGR